MRADAGRGVTRSDPDRFKGRTTPQAQGHHKTETEDTMTLVVRQCPKCGHREAGYGWDSIAEATEAGALLGAWSCPVCSWPEAELVEIDRSEDTSPERERVSANRDDRPR
jgi:hypothetical protein